MRRHPRPSVRPKPISAPAITAEAFGDIAGNDKIMGSLASAAQGLGGSQGSGRTPAIPPPPNLDTNSAAIAQMAPQLMAASMAKRKRTPGLSLNTSGINQGFGGVG